MSPEVSPQGLFLIHSYCEKSLGWDHAAAKWKDAADATRRR